MGNNEDLSKCQSKAMHVVHVQPQKSANIGAGLAGSHNSTQYVHIVQDKGLGDSSGSGIFNSCSQGGKHVHVLNQKEDDIKRQTSQMGNNEELSMSQREVVHVQAPNSDNVNIGTVDFIVGSKLKGDGPKVGSIDVEAEENLGEAVTGFVGDDDKTKENWEEVTNFMENLLTTISIDERQGDAGALPLLGWSFSLSSSISIPSMAEQEQGSSQTEGPLRPINLNPIDGRARAGLISNRGAAEAIESCGVRDLSKSRAHLKPRGR
ncbi:uncharacterized protein A4U43_C07F4040 [Asparagus officinalis]|uniref:Uncharacterized protein n=1 Tax=Asparagus officinalis TaxID=4686 RepID=A0A5P1E978_ASPOF|nr:uncharacterized protein A4U43_C07F4040 [Asparagus officinalis]